MQLKAVSLNPLAWFLKLPKLFEFYGPWTILQGITYFGSTTVWYSPENIFLCLIFLSFKYRPNLITYL